MKTNLDFILGLLNLVYVLIKSDKEFADAERAYLAKIIDEEGVPTPVFDRFMAVANSSTERDCYNAGLHHISMCNREERLRAFVWMQQMAFAVGKVSPKEVRLLLYAVKRTDITIEEVMANAEKMEVM
jgi:hypothetical protein